MADAINAKSDVLGERELDAVSGGMSIAGLVALVVAVIKSTDGGTSGGGQKRPDATAFSAIDDATVSAPDASRRGVRTRGSAMRAPCS
jgi:hypothetical protein